MNFDVLQMKCCTTVAFFVPTKQRSGAKYCVAIMILHLNGTKLKLGSRCVSNVQVGGNYCVNSEENC